MPRSRKWRYDNKFKKPAIAARSLGEWKQGAGGAGEAGEQGEQEKIIIPDKLTNRQITNDK
jgi:hypothetical protein